MYIIVSNAINDNEHIHVLRRHLLVNLTRQDFIFHSIIQVGHEATTVSVDVFYKNFGMGFWEPCLREVIDKWNMEIILKYFFFQIYFININHIINQDLYRV
jgi:hypothetical protein